MFFSFVIVFLSLGNVFAQDGNLTAVRTFNFDDPNLFNAPVARFSSPDQTYNLEQTSTFPNLSGFSITTLVKKCYPNPIANSCRGTENQQGAKEISIISTNSSTRFKTFRAHFWNPSRPFSFAGGINYHKVYINYTLFSPGLSSTNPLVCTSNVGTPVINGRVIEIDFTNLPTEVDIEISCNRFLSRIDYSSVGAVYRLMLGGSDYFFSNPILLDKLIITSSIATKPSPNTLSLAKLLKLIGIDKPICQSGSIIRTDNQSLGETVKIIGSPHELVYFSYRVPGRLDDKKLIYL